MRGIQNALDRLNAVSLFAFGDIVTRKAQIIKNAVCIGPLPKQIVVLEKMIMAECSVSNDKRLHRHGIFFHDVANARIGVDDDFVSEPLQAAAVKRLMKGKALTEAPVTVHQRQADRSVGVEHLLRRDHLSLDGIDVEAQLVQRDTLDRIIDLAQCRKIPVWAGEERRRGLESYRLRQACVRHECPLSQTIRGTPRRFAKGRRHGASRSADAWARPRYRLARDRCRATSPSDYPPCRRQPRHRRSIDRAEAPLHQAAPRNGRYPPRNCRRRRPVPRRCSIDLWSTELARSQASSRGRSKQQCRRFRGCRKTSPRLPPPQCSYDG